MRRGGKRGGFLTQSARHWAEEKETDFCDRHWMESLGGLLVQSARHWAD